MESETRWGIALAMLTALLWGMYGPALEKSRGELWSPFKPFVFVGLAYTIWGVVTGLVAMSFLKDSYSYTGPSYPAMKWGFLAGSLGAFGAMSLTMAMFKAKSAALVMPIVYGGAVSVTAVVTYLLLRFSTRASAPADPRMWLGMLLVAVGIVLVVKYSPRPSLAIAPEMTPAVAAAGEAIRSGVTEAGHSTGRAKTDL